ncbi:MAG: hypothetical protein HPY90_13525 [Syntrophothermus sp.]|uniref:hypothetical protein n=1 Tax=Syntrophothermus sp. TaxID=2736299 RepID=UPI00257FD96E|nr:hypothetical protein [Syntrophothermus sp.]NSW84266.1 hypothetical protein [Syntrophothermus sp.]
MGQNGNIFTLAVEWQEKLQNCKYAGEIYLDPELLEFLAREFSQYMLEEDSLYETALVVLAVNCAYHYYDDQGFWSHFCRLMKIENTIANQEKYGRIIEKRLELFGLKKLKRTGPFRYVGAILEQCGVSKRYIIPLASIIKEFKSPMSWNNLLMMGYRQFQNRVELISCSQYLKNFLKDTAGWKFTMQICHLLMLYEQGFMTQADLKGLPGYQPGFWEEFLFHFYNSCFKCIKNQVPVALKPRLVFVPQERCLAMFFPGRDYAVGVKVPAIQDFWRFPLTLLKSANAWSEYYAGSIQKPGGQQAEWLLPGWIPDGLPALFDPGCGYVLRGRKVKPGEYYLLIPNGYHPKCRVISELGSVRVPGNINYRACHVMVEPGTNIHGYEIENDTNTDIVLTWVEPERFRLWCAAPWLDVFSGSLPPLYVSDFRPIEEQRVALFYTDGSVTRRIRNMWDLEQILKEINSRAPVAGRFFVYNIGRTGTSEIDSELYEIEFCLLPRINIKFVQRLYAYNEEPVIEVDKMFPGYLNLDGCRCVDRNRKKWIISMAVNQVNGTVECQDITAGIGFPVHRASIYYDDGKPVRYLLSSELYEEKDLILTGYPYSDALLGIWQQPSRHLPVKFDGRRLVRITSNQLLQLVKDSNCSINEIILITGEHKVSTGTVIIDLNSVFTSVYAGTGCDVSVCTAKNLIRVLDFCTKICQGIVTGHSYNLNSFPCFHPSFDEWIYSVFACAGVFDDVNILVSGKKVDWIDRIKNEKLKQLLTFYTKIRNGQWNGNIPTGEIELLPPVERWQVALRRVILPYTSGRKILNLSEWFGEIRRQQLRYCSSIAGLPGGRLLSTAWVHYNRHLFERAIAELENIKESSPLIAELRDFLQVLLLLRLARTEMARILIENRKSSGELEMAFMLLQYVLRIFYGEKTGAAPTHLQPEILAELPLRKEDEIFLKLAARTWVNAADVEKNPPESEDWLVLWFLVNLCSDRHQKAGMARKLLQLGKQIPSSPEKVKILEYLKSLER